MPCKPMIIYSSLIRPEKSRRYEAAMIFIERPPPDIAATRTRQRAALARRRHVPLSGLYIILRASYCRDAARAHVAMRCLAELSFFWPITARLRCFAIYGATATGSALLFELTLHGSPSAAISVKSRRVLLYDDVGALMIASAADIHGYPIYLRRIIAASPIYFTRYNIAWPLRRFQRRMGHTRDD